MSVTHKDNIFKTSSQIFMSKSGYKHLGRTKNESRHHILKIVLIDVVHINDSREDEVVSVGFSRVAVEGIRREISRLA